MERREFIKVTAGSAAALAAAIAMGEACESQAKPQPNTGRRVFSHSEAETLSAVAARIVAPLNAEQLQVVPKIDSLLAAADDLTQRDFKQLLWLFGTLFGSLFLEARLVPFVSLEPEAQDKVLAGWRDSRLAFRRSGFQALQRLCLAVAYATPSLYPQIGYPGPPMLVRPDGTTVGGMPAP